VVPFSGSALHELIAHGQWKRNVYETVTVDVADFAAAHAKFVAAKTVRRMGDFFPRRNRIVDSLRCVCDRHVLRPSMKGNYISHTC